MYSLVNILILSHVSLWVDKEPQFQWHFTCMNGKKFIDFLHLDQVQSLQNHKQ